jgi:hypothetical protein
VPCLLLELPKAQTVSGPAAARSSVVLCGLEIHHLGERRAVLTQRLRNGATALARLPKS